MVIWRRMYSNMKSKGHPDYGSCPDGHYGLHGSVSNKPFYLPPVFENGGRYCWVRSPSPPSPPSPRMFCLISRLLLKLAF